VTASSPLLEDVRAHLRERFPAADLEVLRCDEGLVRYLADLALVRAAGSGGVFVYVSAGAGAEPMEEGYGLEFFLVSREPDDGVARLLAMVAQLHADPRYPLSLGQVIEIGHPWLTGSSCDHLLVCLPGPFGDDFEWLSTRERTLRFVWLLPITRAEAELARAQGLGPLQEKLGAAGVDVAARSRDSVV
jgi:hypothetical protein